MGGTLVRGLGFVLVVTAILGIIVIMEHHSNPLDTAASPAAATATTRPIYKLQGSTAVKVETQEEAEIPEPVTTGMLYKFPQIYRNRRVLVIGWGWEHPRAGTTDCDGIFDQYGEQFASGCLSHIPSVLMDSRGIISEDDADLICTVGWSDKPFAWYRYGKLLLKDCEFVPNNHWKMRQQERDLETRKSQ